MSNHVRRRSVTNVCGQRLHLRAGIINDTARAAFTQGHCADLALALHRRTGWPLKVLVESDTYCASLASDRHARRAADRGEEIPPDLLESLWAHVYVQRPDGLLLDITGPHAADTAIARSYDGDGEIETADRRHRLVPATSDQVASLRSCAPPSPGVGELFVDAVLALAPGPELAWPWQEALTSYVAEEVAYAREAAEEQGQPFPLLAADFLTDLDEDYHLLGEALMRGLLPTDLEVTARRMLDTQRHLAA